MLCSVVSRVDELVRRPEADVRVVVNPDRGDVCLGVAGDSRFGELELVEKQPSTHLIVSRGWMDGWMDEWTDDALRKNTKHAK